MDLVLLYLFQFGLLITIVLLIYLQSCTQLPSMVLSSVTKGIKRGAKVGIGVGKVALKKGVKYGKKAGKTSLKTATKIASSHGNAMVNTAIRGVGGAASVTVGNPAPMLAAEGVIMGKDYLVKEGSKRFMNKKNSAKKRKGSDVPPVIKSHMHYHPETPKKPSPRRRNRLGIASQSHGYEAKSKLNQKRVNTGLASGRNMDYFSSATRPTGAKM